MMRLIGYWIRSLRDSDYFPPQEFVADIEPDLRRAVADYLDAGEVFAVYRGVSWCRFFCDYPCGNTELSDGRWVWPSALSHYVRDHRVQLPNEFVQHVQSGTPPLAKSADWETCEPDTSFWKDWCREHASGQYRGRVEAALKVADREAEGILAVAAAKLETASGTSDAHCLWAGCNNRAVVGKALCARCLTNADREVLISHVYFDLRPVLT